MKKWYTVIYWHRSGGVMASYVLAKSPRGVRKQLDEGKHGGVLYMFVGKHADVDTPFHFDIEEYDA